MTILHKFTNRKDYTKRNKNEGRKREAEQSSKKSNKTHTHIPKIAAKWQNKRLPSFASWFVVVLLVVISAICVELRHRCPVLRSMCECVQKREREKWWLILEWCVLMPFWKTFCTHLQNIVSHDFEFQADTIWNREWPQFWLYRCDFWLL